MKAGQRLPTLGWKEQVSLPELGVSKLRAKLDTGARTSALHVESLEEDDGLLRFVVLSGRRERPTRHPIELPNVGRKVVRDSGGTQEDRPTILTRLVCGPVDVVTEVTLTTRDDMNFRMLIGRSALEGRCVVDPGAGYVQTPEPSARRQP